VARQDCRRDTRRPDHASPAEAAGGKLADPDPARVSVVKPHVLKRIFGLDDLTAVNWQTGWRVLDARREVAGADPR
jgi:hypothetical protein